MSQKDDFINDFKIQATRDLTGAELMLKHDGPIEIVAWLCEQSFEKTIKYVYAYYKLNFQDSRIDSVYEKMKGESHLGSHKLVINMMREVLSAFWKDIWMQALNNPLFPSQLKSVIEQKFKEVNIYGAGSFDKMFDDGIKQINTLLQNKDNYNRWLQESTADGLRKYLESVNYDQKIKDIVVPLTAELTDALSHSPYKDLTPQLPPTIYQKLMEFIMKSIALSVRVLPYFETSRYPSKECNYVNLQLFRQNESRLKPYLDYLIKELGLFLSDSDDFIDSLMTLHGKTKN